LALGVEGNAGLGHVEGDGDDHVVLIDGNSADGGINLGAAVDRLTVALAGRAGGIGVGYDAETSLGGGKSSGCAGEDQDTTRARDNSFFMDVVPPFAVWGGLH